MYKKLFITLGVLIALIFSFNICFATNTNIGNGLQNAANGVRNVKIIPESTTALTGYTNGYRPNQGIGSGAGYLEKSNGIFAKITN